MATEKNLCDLHVVTGATSGVGRAVAYNLAACNLPVLAIGRSRCELTALEALFPDHIATRELDLLDDKAIDLLAADLSIAGVRALIHCAGVYFNASLDVTPVLELDLLYRTNVRAPFLLTQRLLPLLERGRGQIVFVNSSSALTAGQGVGLGAFASLQHACRSLADFWRLEVNARGVRVLSIFPGRINTSRTTRLFEKEGRSYDPSLLLQPEDIAALVTMALQLPATVELTELSVRPAKKSY